MPFTLPYLTLPYLTVFAPSLNEIDCHRVCASRAIKQKSKKVNSAPKGVQTKFAMAK